MNRRVWLVPCALFLGTLLHGGCPGGSPTNHPTKLDAKNNSRDFDIRELTLPAPGVLEVESLSPIPVESLALPSLLAMNGGLETTPESPMAKQELSCTLQPVADPWEAVRQYVAGKAAAIGISVGTLALALPYLAELNDARLYPPRIVSVLGRSDGWEGVLGKGHLAGPPDLKGEMIGVSGRGASLRFLLEVLRGAGLGSGSTHFENFTEDSILREALRGGRVSVAVMDGPWVEGSLQQESTGLLARSSETPGLEMAVLLIRPDLHKKRPDRVRAIVKASIEAPKLLQVERIGVLSGAKPGPIAKQLAKATGISESACARSLLGLRPVTVQESLVLLQAPADQPGGVRLAFSRASQTWYENGFLNSPPEALPDEAIQTGFLERFTSHGETLDSSIRLIPISPPTGSPEQEAQGETPFRVYFLPNMTTVDGRGNGVLKAVARQLGTLGRSSAIIIEAHSDAVSTATSARRDGYALARARALTIRNHLADQFHIDPVRCRIRVFGPDLPGNKNPKTPRDHLQNRRVDIRFE